MSKEQQITSKLLTCEQLVKPYETKKKIQIEMTFVRGDLFVFLEGKLNIYYTFKVIRLSIVTLFTWLDLDATCQISRCCLQPSTITSMLFSHQKKKKKNFSVTFLASVGHSLAAC